MRSSARRATRQGRRRDQHRADSGGQLRRQVPQSAPVAVQDIEVEAELAAICRRRGRRVSARRATMQERRFARSPPASESGARCRQRSRRNLDPPSGKRSSARRATRQERFPCAPTSAARFRLRSRRRGRWTGRRAGPRRRSSARRATTQEWRAPDARHDPQAAAVGVHDVQRLAVAPAHESDPPAVGRPHRTLHLGPRRCALNQSEEAIADAEAPA